jgi:hypothetical protein
LDRSPNYHIFREKERKILMGKNRMAAGGEFENAIKAIVSRLQRGSSEAIARAGVGRKNRFCAIGTVFDFNANRYKNRAKKNRAAIAARPVRLMRR